MKPELLSVRQDVRLAACPECHSIYRISKESLTSKDVFECYVCKGRVNKTITVGISDDGCVMINGRAPRPMY